MAPSPSLKVRQEHAGTVMPQLFWRLHYISDARGSNDARPPHSYLARDYLEGGNFGFDPFKLHFSTAFRERC